MDPETKEIVLVDEVLTPDSSRFWPADQYEVGKTQASYDKVSSFPTRCWWRSYRADSVAAILARLVDERGFEGKAGRQNASGCSQGD